MADQPVILIKIGGEAAAREDSLGELINEITALREIYRFVILHGGGSAISAMQKQYGLEPHFENGIRMTTSEEMDLVDAALAGQMNKKLVRQFNTRQVPAVGISCCDGPLTLAESISPAGTPEREQSRTGKITAVHPELLQLLLDNQFLPVISPVSLDSLGQGLNINADEAALALAAALPAASLVFLSDIPGILKEGEVLQELTPLGVEKEITQGVITGGMIPKTRSSVQALNHGLASVVIGEYSRQGDLESLLLGRRGSRIVRG